MKAGMKQTWSRVLIGVAVAACGMCIAGCDDSDASNMSITLNTDRSGTIQTTRLVIPEVAGNGQPASAGVVWEASAQVVTSKGTFASVSEVGFEDISFSCESTAKGLHVLRVTMPRGPEARWVKALTQPSVERRKETTRAIYPEQKESRLGSVIAIRLTLPTVPISHGVSPVVGGISESAEKNVVTLTVRVDAAMKTGNEIVWDVTWGEPKR